MGRVVERVYQSGTRIESLSGNPLQALMPAGCFFARGLDIRLPIPEHNPMWFLALCTIVGSGLLLLLSAFPGMLEQVPRNLALILSGLYVFLALAITLRHLLRASSDERPRRRVSAYLVLVTLILTPVLLGTYLPRRLMFEAYRSDFEALLADAPDGGNHVTVPLNADLDVMWIDHWGTDNRGGVYFRTLGTGQKGGFTPQSFGFVHQPNYEGSPFGDREYRLHHLTGDWYTFSAVDE